MFQFLELENYVNEGNNAIAYNQAKRDIEWNRKWMIRNVDVIDRWLKGGVTILRSTPILIVNLTMLLYFVAYKML